MKTADKLEVYFDGTRVGTLVPYKKYLSAFEYTDSWLKEGFSLNPFVLPLSEGVKIAKSEPFEGIFGVFADSLPDGWGRLLVDRMLRKLGEDPAAIDPFTRLSIVGSSGMGGLEYKPCFKLTESFEVLDFDRLASECKAVLESKESEDLDVLFDLGGSSGGARPKAMMTIDGGEWIVKFPSHVDSDDIGVMEYDYMNCAEECGIEVPEFRLFPSQRCSGYFGVKRFDRRTDRGIVKKVHMATVSALLEVSHRVPALDYTSLMSLTWQLTRSSEELIKLFRLMCFNIFAHNRDDHSNNFSFLYENGDWRLSPAYDLTYSNSIGGEHATTVAGEGRNPGLSDILKVAEKAGITRTLAEETARNINEKVNRYLVKYISR